MVGAVVVAGVGRDCGARGERCRAPLTVALTGVRLAARRSVSPIAQRPT